MKEQQDKAIGNKIADQEPTVNGEPKLKPESVPKPLLAFDAKRAAQNATGLGNYSRYVISLLQRFGPDTPLRLYVPSARKAKLLKRLASTPQTVIRYPRHFLSKHFPSLWRVWGITHDLRSDGIQLYHGLSNELPLNIRKARGLKTVVTIHDLLFLRFPQGYHAIDRIIYHFKFRQACLHADRIIAVSQFTKQEIIRYFQIAPDKIDVVYQGCDPSFRVPANNAAKNEVRQMYHLPQRYILYVGSIERRKNLLLLAQSLQYLPADISVIAIGRRTAYADEVETYLRAQGMSERMHLISGVPFNHLPALYQMATVFVYPSRCEGFGIPLLEALCSGTPAIGCTGSCLEEAGGPDSLYVSPDDTQALAHAIDRILSDDSLRQQMITRGHQYADRFTDSRLYGDLFAVYQEVLAKEHIHSNH